LAEQADKHATPPIGTRRRPGAGRGASASGLWHRPQLLNVMADLLLLLAAVGLGYALVHWIIVRQAFPIRDVVVLTPPAQVTVAQLEYAARSSLKGNFFTVDLDAVRGAFEKLPWVRHAEVRRRWPSAVELRLEEHQAVAYWSANDSGETRLVNRQGEVFTASSNAAMPAFAGPEGLADELLQRYADFSALVARLGRKLDGLSLSSRLAWQLRLDDGLLVELGREQTQASLYERLERFVRSYPQVLEQIDKKVLVADLRYPNGFALKQESQPGGKKGKE
jgi:cell division protein FtsQ